jgi:hypothetical protein
VRPSRDVWVGLLVLAATAVAVALLAHRPDEPGPAFRIDGRGPAGLSGIAAGLESAGFAVDRGERPTIPDHGLVVSVEPAGMTHDEAAAWMSAVRSGADVLLATDRPDPLTEALGLRFEPASGALVVMPDGARAFPALADPTIRSGTELAALPTGAEPLVRSGSGAAMAVIPVGSGSVWAIADPSVLTNTGIATDGLAIALPLAAAAGGPVTVDEFHHGAAPPLGSVSYLPAPVKILGIQAALVAVLAAASAARRLGPVAHPAAAASRGGADLVRALAGLHRAGGRRGAVTAPLARAYRRGLGGLADRAATQLAELERAPSDAAAVRACGEIEALTRRVTSGDR